MAIAEDREGAEHVTVDGRVDQGSKGREGGTLS